MPSPHPPCIACGSTRVAEVVYGRDADRAALQDRIDRGEVVLLSPDFVDEPAQWHCLDCQHEWAGPEWLAELLAESERMGKRREEEAERVALARGRMSATANGHGWAMCPHCHTRFSIRHALSWDGAMHRSCRTRLEIEEGNAGGTTNEHR